MVHCCALIAWLFREASTPDRCRQRPVVGPLWISTHRGIAVQYTCSVSNSTLEACRWLRVQVLGATAKILQGAATDHRTIATLMDAVRGNDLMG